MIEGDAGDSIRYDGSQPLHDEILRRLERGDSLDVAIEEVVLKSPRVAHHIRHRAHLIARQLNWESINDCQTQLTSILWERLRQKDYRGNRFCLDRVLRSEIAWAGLETLRQYFVGRSPKSRKTTISPVGDIDEGAILYNPDNVFEFDDMVDCVRRQIESFPPPIAKILTLRILHDETVTAIAREVNRAKSRITQIINKNIAAFRELVAKRCLGKTDA